MRKTIWVRLIPAVLASTMILAGCARGSVGGVAAGAANLAAAAVKTKAPLQIPASFANDDAKRDFAIKAVNDGYYKEAAPLLESALAAKGDANGYSSLGTARYNLNDMNSAIDAWSKAAEQNPKLAAEMKNNIGNALRDLHKTEEAKAAYQEALKLDPHQWTSASNLAAVLHSENQTADAIKLLETALKANPDIAPLKSMLDTYKQETVTHK